MLIRAERMASLAAHRASGFSEDAGDGRYALMEHTLPGGRP